MSRIGKKPIAVPENVNVAVDGQTLTSPGVRVTPESRITVDGKELPAPERARLFRFHKPRGMLTTARDPHGRENREIPPLHGPAQESACHSGRGMF